MRQRGHNILRPASVPDVTSYDLARIGGGNDIDPSGYVGVKKIATELATLGSPYDPTLFPATEDGIGWGWHYALGEWVLLLNDSRSGVAHDLPTNAPVFITHDPIVISDLQCYVIALT